MAARVACLSVWCLGSGDIELGDAGGPKPGMTMFTLNPLCVLTEVAAVTVQTTVAYVV